MKFSQPTATIRSETVFYMYDEKRVEYTIWLTPRTSDTLTIIFLGLVQIGKMPRWVAEHCPDNSIVVQGGPLWNASEDGSATIDFMLTYIKTVTEYIYSVHTPINITVIAESQAAPGALWLFSRPPYENMVTSMTLVQPLGLNRDIFLSSFDQAADVLAKRVLRNARHQIKAFLLDPRQRHNHRVLSKHINLKHPVSRAQYATGLLYDAMPDLQRTLTVCPRVSIICGANDKLFPPSELAQNLLHHGIELPLTIVPDVSHATLASKAGLKLLDAALASRS